MAPSRVSWRRILAGGWAPVLAAILGVFAGFAYLLHARDGGTLAVDSQFSASSLAGHEVKHPPTLRPPRSNPERGLWLSKISVDLGTHRMGEMLTASVDIGNAGADPIDFRVKARCGCVETSLDPDVSTLKPGGITQLLIGVRTDNRIGPFKEEVAVVRTDVPCTPQWITLQGVLVHGIRVVRDCTHEEPSLLGQTRVAAFRLRGSADLGDWKPVRVHVWSDKRPDIRHACTFRVERARATEKAGLEYCVEVDVPGSSDTGRKRIWVCVETSLGSALWPRTLISYDVRPAVRPAVPQLHLGVVRAGAPKSGRVRILPANSGVQFAIRDAHLHKWQDSRMNDPDFVARFAEDEIGWYVDVSYRGSIVRERRLRSMLVVETDRTDVSSLEIPVLAVVQFGAGK